MAILRKSLRRLDSNRGDAGFTMIELVVAMLVLTVVLLLLAVVQISAITTVTEARKLQQATAFANEAVEQMRAIPWNTLSKGMYSGFLGAAGGDPLVNSGVLNVDGMSVPLVIAPTTNDQNLANPARPLFDESGSHTQNRQDASLTGTVFTIKAYVTDSAGGASFGIVGIVVVVEWPNRYGGVSRTTVRSEAYGGGAAGCGHPETQPFLAACQSLFEASSGTGTVAVEISASNVDPDPALIGPRPLMHFASSNIYSLSMNSAGAFAALRSQQVNYVDSILQYGGNTYDDNIAATDATQKGFLIYPQRATDDATNEEGWVPDPLPEPPVNQGASDEYETEIVDANWGLSFRVRSDYARPGLRDASITASCALGIPNGQPCARSEIQNENGLLTGSGYLLMETKEGTIFRLSRRLSNETPGNVESAWVARFASAPGSGDVGCTSISGAGCVSAGAKRTMAPLNIGKVATGTGSWGADAAQGMVILEGDPSCPAGQNTYYTESVLVQRGADQPDAAPVVSRCGQLRYWNGTGYTTVPIRNAGLDTINTAPVTWTDAAGDYLIVATTQIQVLPVVIDNPTPADPGCQAEACTVRASAGKILMVSTYDVKWKGYELVYFVSTIVTSPSAQAMFKGA